MLQIDMISVQRLPLATLSGRICFESGIIIIQNGLEHGLIITFTGNAIIREKILPHRIA
jgi:hypothetical protein